MASSTVAALEERAKRVVVAGLVQPNPDEKRGGYVVKSQSGSGGEYEVDRWNCTCPYRARNATCKHVIAVKLVEAGTKVEVKELEVNISLLKSAIQKAVRRNQSRAAVTCAAALWKREPVEVVRRVFVIMMEDAVLHPDAPYMASCLNRKEFDGGDRGAWMQIVLDLASCKYRDWVEVREEVLGQPAAEMQHGDYAALAKLPPAQWELVDAILLRAKYGGMKYDKSLLCEAARVWTGRFARDSGGWMQRMASCYPPLPMPEATNLDKKLAMHDVALEAVDHHCSPIASILAKKPEVQQWWDSHRLGRDDWEYVLLVKWAMWFGRSSTTEKIDLVRGELVVPGTDVLSPADWTVVGEFMERFGREIANLSRWWLQQQFG